MINVGLPQCHQQKKCGNEVVKPPISKMLMTWDASKKPWVHHMTLMGPGEMMGCQEIFEGRDPGATSLSSFRGRPLDGF